jgi:hypothetical protein
VRLIPSLNTLPSGATRADGQLDKRRSCAVIANKTTDEDGFIDTRNDLGGYKVYVSATAVREMARLIGMPDDKDVAALVEEFEAKIAEQQKELDELNTLAKVIDLKKARKLITKETD